MFSIIDRNCRHFRHINFLCLHIQICTAYRYGWRMGFHAPNSQQTCPRNYFKVNKISEYKHNIRNMNVIHYKDWYVGTENMIEKRGCDSLQVSK